MKTLHVEFDCDVTDVDAERFMNAPESLQNNIMEGLETYDDYMNIENFKIKPKED